MKKTLVFLLIFFSLILKAQTPYKLDTMPEGNGIIVEKFEKKYWNNLNRFTENNRIYKAGREFLFDYQYFSKDSIEKKIVFDTYVSQKHSDSIPQQISFDTLWHFADGDKIEKNQHEKLSLTVAKGSGGDEFFEEDMLKEEYQQTIINYNYFGKVGVGETTGLVENERNIWMHPPRERFFMITEINPFPYIKMPLKIGSGPVVGKFICR